MRCRLNAGAENCRARQGPWRGKGADALSLKRGFRGRCLLWQVCPIGLADERGGSALFERRDSNDRGQALI